MSDILQQMKNAEARIKEMEGDEATRIASDPAEVLLQESQARELEWIRRLTEAANDLADAQRKLAEVEKERAKDDVTILRLIEERNIALADKTALRNAADGMAGGLREALDVVHDQTDELLTGAEEALAAYAALISEGKKPTL